MLGLNAHMHISFLIVKVTSEESFGLSQTQFPHLEDGVHTNLCSSIRVVLSKIFFEKQFRGPERWLNSLVHSFLQRTKFDHPCSHDSSQSSVITVSGIRCSLPSSASTRHMSMQTKRVTRIR